MHLVVGIYHPAHFHFFKNLIQVKKEEGHQVTVLSRNKDVTTKLLEESGFEFHEVGGYSKSIAGKISNWKTIHSNINSILSNTEKPDYLAGIGDMYLGLYGFLNRIPSTIFSDDDIITINSVLFSLFGDKLVTPDNCRINYSRFNFIKHNTYAGFHELSYLHPNNYKPDNSIFEKYNLPHNRKYVVIRQVGWTAAHDISKSGLSNRNLIGLINIIESKGFSVYISSEKELPDSLRKYKLDIEPTAIHHILFYSSLLISDSQTMSTEAAILGTPVIRSNSFVGGKDLSNFTELQKRYKLIFNLRRFKNVTKATKFILNNSNAIKKIWDKRRKAMLEDKIDVAPFLNSLFIKN